MNMNSDKITDFKIGKVQVMMEEYKSLRSESLQSMGNRNSILTFGLGTIGLIFHAGISIINTQDVFSFLIFSFFLPVLSLLLLVLWMGEAERISRVGVYLVDFEKKVNEIFKNDEQLRQLLHWETWLREFKQSKNRTNQLLYPYLAVVILFLGISISSYIFILIYSHFNEQYMSINVWIKKPIMIVTPIMVLLTIIWTIIKGKSFE
ncbi:MAG: hypothetical protein HQ591_06520 [candidate division Zixibacteria bacterium]|nr:hypothetical protein [Candidatus Tariuqbacter arcticus]